MISKKESCRLTFKCSFARTLPNAKYQPSQRRFGGIGQRDSMLEGYFRHDKALKQMKKRISSVIGKCLNTIDGMALPLQGNKESVNYVSLDKFTT